MRSVLRTLLALVVLISVVACSTIPNSPYGLGNGDVEFEIPKPERWKLANGMNVIYYHNDEIPQIRGTLYFPGGDLTDPTGIAGLAQATGKQIRGGSIKGIKPDDLDKRLDDLAASIESGFGDEYGTASFFSLEEDFDEVFSLFTDVVRRPAFSQDRLALWKRLAADGILRRRDNPGTMASMAFGMLLFGEDSAFTKAISKESLSKITRTNMREFHSRFVRPDGAYLTLSGSLSREQVETAINAKFADWSPGTFKRPSLPSVSHAIVPGIYVLERDYDQATIRLGHRGPSRHSPDIYPIKIYNHMFGHSGFGSTLFREIRSKLGLAYSVYGGLWPGAVEGQFMVGMGTRVSEAPKAIDRTLELTKESIDELPDETRFKAAKSAVTKSFVFRFADPSYIADRTAMLELLGYPDTYDQDYLENIRGVTPSAVKDAGQRWVHPEELVVVIVGRVSAEEIAEAFKGEFDVYRLDFDTAPKIAGKLTLK